MTRRARRTVLLGAALAGAAAVLYLSSQTKPPGAATGREALYRLHVRVPLAYVHATRARFAPEGQKALLSDVRRRVESLGYTGTLTTIQDPTDNSIVTVLSRARSSRPASTDGVVVVERREPVAAPPPMPRSVTGAVDPRTTALPLEPWLTADEAFAVRRALSEEMNTRHLKGLASTLEPRAPIAASMLRAKATVLDPRRPDPRSASQRVHDLLADLLAPSPPVPPGLAARLDAGRSAVSAYAASQGLPLDVAQDDVRRAAYYASARGLASAVQTGAPRPLVELGVLCVRPLPHGGAIVDPGLLARACPETGRERFVSPSALWLAHAAGKPAVSGVRDPDRIESVYGSTDKANEGADPRDDKVRRLRAKTMMQRAEKTLQRDRWIRWYRRHAETDGA